MYSPKVGRLLFVLACACVTSCVSRSNTAPPPTIDATSDAPAPAVAAEPSTTERPEYTLARLRASFTTEVQLEPQLEPAADPPSDVFAKVHYRAPLGDNVAYVTPPTEGDRKPAIVWIAGGFEWSIGPWLWEPAPRENDQTAAAFRNAGVILMLPALRGQNGNPGRPECFGGEVDDVIAAAEFLSSRPDVDPDRIYLGGHSTGGTMALLVAESTDRFREVFAFGPVTHPVVYGAQGCLPESLSDRELEIRSAGQYLHEITTPTFILEGEYGNAAMLEVFDSLRGDAPVEVVEVPGANHFDVLAPATETLANRILGDVGEKR